MGKSSNVNPELYKKDLIEKYADLHGITKAEAEARFEDVLGLITEHLVAGYDVKLNNFFNLFVRPRRAKKATNPVTGVPMEIPATKTVVARMTKPLKDRIQGKK
jgi:DNA-binding protein HU-beta